MKKSEISKKFSRLIAYPTQNPEMKAFDPDNPEYGLKVLSLTHRAREQKVMTIIYSMI